jgi:hypothetical protein
MFSVLMNGTPSETKLSPLHRGDSPLVTITEISPSVG